MTVIDADMRVIYDTFVKPVSKVVDYNTRWVCLLALQKFIRMSYITGKVKLQLSKVFR